MAHQPPRNPRSAGAILALCVIGGAVVGAIQGQPTIGVLAGTALGVLIAVIVWLVDRRR